MNESRLTYLFGVYLNKRATLDERDELMELVSLPENNEKVQSLLSSTWQQFRSENHLFSDKQGEEILLKILNREADKEPVKIAASRHRINRLMITTVAAIFICVVTGMYFWFQPGTSNQQVSKVSKRATVVEDIIVPGGNKAVLTLSDGSHITLDSSHIGALIKQGNAKVVNLSTATLAYKAGSEHTGEVVYNTLSTFNGGQYQLILSDGTKVWLNASSSIYYPTIFTGTERRVAVTGEAYFEVAKNASMPFEISVRDVQVQVLGTHFNIMAYNDETSINTTLLEGAVKILKGSETRLLLPGQQSRITKSKSIKVVDADIEEVMAWKNGWFQFDGYDIEKVLRQVSRWYNVDIAYEGKIPAGHFTGSVSRENNISQVLKIMEAGGVRFKIEGRKIVVYADKKF